MYGYAHTDRTMVPAVKFQEKPKKIEALFKFSQDVHFYNRSSAMQISQH